MGAQLLVVGVGAAAPVIAAGIVAPKLFHQHLAQAGVADAHVLGHAEAAFDSAFAFAMTIGVVMSVVAAGVVSWFLVRRIAAPIEELANSAEHVAAGLFDVQVPTAPFSSELQQLSASFDDMARQLATTGATRTRMLADLAHEVRTPLATLQAYIDGIEDGVIQPDADAMQTMHSQVERLRRLADDIREVARAEDQELDPVLLDLREAADIAVRAAAPRYAAKRVQLVHTAAALPCPIRADAIRLQQVLGNLLDNALRHTPPDGIVEVSTSRGDDWCTAVVRDNGDGIPADQLQAVFERFHRVDPSRATADGSGSGLGLTIARAIVRAHGGSISATSDGKGMGARFELRLPLDDSSAGA